MQERNINQLPLRHASTGYRTCNPGICPGQELNQRFHFAERCPYQLNHTSQSSLNNFKGGVADNKTKEDHGGASLWGDQEFTPGHAEFEMCMTEPSGNANKLLPKSLKLRRKLPARAIGLESFLTQGNGEGKTRKEQEE